MNTIKDAIINSDIITWQEISNPSMLPKEPLVSCKMITYNHEKFIAQAIEGVLMQKTDFPFELVIGEDCSTDKTRDVVFSYQQKYPEIIRVITSESNVGMIPNGIRTSNACRGKYIALCEGDDYWIDSQKLSKQVMFMMQHPNLSMSFHAARIDYVDGSRGSKIHRYKGRQFFKAKEVILGGGGFYPTCSSMFRRDVLEDFPAFFYHSPIGDVTMALNAVAKGDVGYIDEIMAVRNVHVPGSWTMRMTESNFDQKIDRLIKFEKVRNAFNKHTGFKFKRFLKKKESSSFRHRLITTIVNREDRKKNYELVKKRMLLTDRFVAYIGCLINFALLRRKLSIGLKNIKKQIGPYTFDKLKNS
jgi:glycosyltransferase involved in cell wall biosynthesis